MTNRYTTNNNNIPYDILAKELTHHHHHTFYFISISNTHTHEPYDAAQRSNEEGEQWRVQNKCLGNKEGRPLLQMRRRREH